MQDFFAECVVCVVRGVGCEECDSRAACAVLCATPDELYEQELGQLGMPP